MAIAQRELRYKIYLNDLLIAEFIWEDDRDSCFDALKKVYHKYYQLRKEG